MGQFRVKNKKNSIRVENFWKWQRVVGQRQFYPKIHADPILLLKYVLFILFGFFRDRVNFDDYHRENIYLYDWPILMIITIFADIYNWFMRFTWSGNMLQWGHRSHRIPKELKVVSHFVALVGPGFGVLLGCPPVFIWVCWSGSISGVEDSFLQYWESTNVLGVWVSTRR